MSVIGLDDWIHAICQQIPNRGQHCVRYYGVYANRTRKAILKNDLPRNPFSCPEPDSDELATTSKPSRASWARLIRKVFEVDPLLCTKCGTEMKIISVITEHAVVDKIIRHIQKKATEETTVARSPPQTNNLPH